MLCKKNLELDYPSHILYLSIVGDSDKVKISIVDEDEVFRNGFIWLSFHRLYINIHLMLFTDALISTLVNVHQAKKYEKTNFMTMVPTFFTFVHFQNIREIEHRQLIKMTKL